MSILTFGLGPTGGTGGSGVSIFGKEVSVELETPIIEPIDTTEVVAIELETTPNIDIELNSVEVNIDIDQQELNIDKSCPQP